MVFYHDAQFNKGQPIYAGQDTVVAIPQGIWYRVLRHPKRFWRRRLPHALIRIVYDENRSTAEDTLFSERAEAPYMPYQGRFIRNVELRQLPGFQFSIFDSTRRLETGLVRFANRMHSKPRDWMLNQHIIFKPLDEVDPFLLADNERLLRRLPFLQDARIVLRPVRGEPDKVDAFITTKDVFTLTGDFRINSESSYQGTLVDENFLGMGQRLQFSLAYAKERNPVLGYDFAYRKINLLGSFVNIGAIYSIINTADRYADQYEEGIALRIDRPLYIPTAKYVGGLVISRNRSLNVFSQNDTLFRPYQYIVTDVWAGRTFGITALDGPNRGGRNRLLFSGRLFHQSFYARPALYLDPNSTTNAPIAYVDSLSLNYPGEISFIGKLSQFSQNFYRTRFVLGFGRTEDIPYGHLYGITFGHQHRGAQNRFYVGAEIDNTAVLGAGHFFNYTARIGTFIREQNLEDGVATISLQLLTRLYSWGSLRFRHTFFASAVSSIDRNVLSQLRANDPYGVRGFSSNDPSLLGDQRMVGRAETTMFTRIRVAGFRFAFFASGECAAVTKGKYTRAIAGFSGGLRTRNENWVFNTVELRLFYFPNGPADVNSFKVNVAPNIFVPLGINLIRAPEFLQLNLQ